MCWGGGGAGPGGGGYFVKPVTRMGWPETNHVSGYG